jgi:hypothetical protein
VIRTAMSQSPAEGERSIPEGGLEFAYSKRESGIK